MNFKLYTKYYREFDQDAAIAIDIAEDKPLRFNVWDIKPEHVKRLFKDSNTDNLPGKKDSQHILRKVEGALRRITESDNKAKKFLNDIINSDSNISNSIALHEIMESIKGESDKARNLGIDITKISNEGILPALPLSRIAASIGRKIVFQKGFRFQSSDSMPKTSSEVEQLYYENGILAIRKLEELGYLKINENLSTIKDYIDKKDIKKKFPKVENITNKVFSISLNEEIFNIELFKKKAKDNDEEVLTPEAAYFLNRTESDLDGTELGVITDILNTVNQITQASTIVIPDTSKKLKTLEELAKKDLKDIKLDDKTAKARKKIYDNPNYVHKSIHSLMELLNKEAMKTGKSGTQIITKMFNGHQTIINSLFGLKRSDDFSIDKKESISGQNLSKTTPLDDLVEYYDVLQDGQTDPVALHMLMRGGRNVRLYYDNSVLNPHASKQSRYMLTGGLYEVDLNSDDFNYLVYAIKEQLGDETLVFKDFKDATGSKLDTALKIYEKYENSTDLTGKLVALSKLSTLFPSTDYVSLLTTIKAVQDIRNSKDGKVSTEFNVSADATASGGTLTFLQALGSNPAIAKFLERIGLLKDADGNLKIDLDDLYGLMTETIENFLAGKDIENLVGQDLTSEITGPRKLLKNTLDMLFNEGKDARSLSKDPTMTFIYGQGRKGASTTMARSLADRVIDNLDNKQTRKYLAELFKNDNYLNVNSQELKQTRGLYKKIVQELITQGLTEQLYDLMDASINQAYLKDFKEKSERIFSLLEKLDPNKPFKILPAGAVMEGKAATAENIETYGMPISKIFEVSNPVSGGLASEGNHTVLTRLQKLTKSVMDVSTVHGIDSGLIYHTADNTIGSSGVIVTHDEIRGDIATVRASEKEYVKQAIEMTGKYDIHQQIMLALKVYSPEIAATEEFKALMSEIDLNITEKQEITKRINPDTDALIGDGDAYKKFAGKETTSVPTKKASSSTKPSKVSIVGAVLNELSGDSEIIQRFLNAKNKVFKGDKNEFIPETDTITISTTSQGREGATEGTARKLDITNTKDRQTQTELIEHEILHANTVAYIEKALNDPFTADPNAERDIRYFQKAIAALEKFIDPKKDPRSFDHLKEETFDRISYIVGRNSPGAQIAEFVAIMGSESETATEIYNILAKDTPTKTLTARIKEFIQRVKETFLALTDDDLAKQINIEKLYGALSRTLDQGVEMREQNFHETQKYLKDFQKTLGAGINPKTAINIEKAATLRYLNAAVAGMLTSKLEHNGKRIIGNLHEIMIAKFPMYSDAVDKLRGVYSIPGSEEKELGFFGRSEALQQLLHTITGEGIDKTKKADILALYAEVSGNQSEIMANSLNKFHELLAPISKEEKTTIGRFVTQMPLHEYFVQASDITTGKDIDAEVLRLQDILRKSNLQTIRDVDMLINRNVHGQQVEGIYNLDTRYPLSDSSKNTMNIRKLLALKSIQAIGTKEFENFLKHTDLVNLIKDHTVANRLSLLENEGTSNLPDSLMPEIEKERAQMRVIELDELYRYEYGDETGWKVLRVPTKDTLGIVYNPIIDSSEVIGAFTDIKLKATGIDVFGKHTTFKEVVETATGNKLLLTNAEKQTLEVIEDFSQTLVRGTAHSMAIKESQIIRNTLLKEETRHIADSPKSIQKLKNIIISNNIDNPWFVKLGDGIKYGELSAEIRAKYKPVGNRASNVKGFNEEVDLVRKDISHWLLGGSSKSLFENPQLKWTMRIVKNLISGTKIGMVVLNPIKIAKDNVSNISYLTVMGVSPAFIIKNYREISRDFSEYKSLQEQIIQLKIQLTAKPESTKLKDKLKALQKLIKKNSVGDLGTKGFINSLGSDLVTRNADTLSGFQADAHTALKYLLINKKGKKNLVSHFILQLQKLGFNGEDFLSYIGNIAKKGGDTKGMGEQLDKVADRLSQIRTEDDIISYVAQYTTSPSSEAVRLGSNMTDLTDVLTKETLYRHLVENEDMSTEDARIRVLDSFPDYKENLPLSIKHLSDVGIIMFPSFWLRIQKVIYRMAKDKPISLATELMFEEAIGNNIETIFDANIINKSNTFGGFLHTPLEAGGVGSVVPMNLFNF